ncbi:MAG: hypothetical protein KAI91_00990 [Candidatus Omnitrophica bacterium]|nr:hypothetical protein [Candidatus Omnitrophota bacterium]
MNKVLIVYASFGEGHKKAAYALSGSIESTCKDLLDFTHPIIKKIYSLSYMLVTQHLSALWRITFFIAKGSLFSFSINKVHKFIFFSLFRYLKETRPKIVVVTHFFPSSLISIVKEKFNIKLISVVTDLRVHPLWVDKCVDTYFVALSITKNDLIKLGIDANKIISGYVPLREGFIKNYSVERLRNKFKVGARPSIIFVSSLRGRFPFLKVSIEKFIKKFNIFVIYGKNNELKQYLEKNRSSNLRAFSFYEEIWELFFLSSVIITKPGGLTIFEGIYNRKPFIFTHYIPGQEKENMDLLIKHGIAKFVRNESELIEAIKCFGKKSDDIRDNYPIKIEDIRLPFIELIQKLSNA